MIRILPSRDDTLDHCDVRTHARRRHVSYRPPDDLARKVLVGRHALLIGMGETVDHHLETLIELVRPCQSDLNPGWRRLLQVTLQGTSKDILE
jgi:hypothetical protein